MEAFGAGTDTAGPGSRGASVNRLGAFQRDETRMSETQDVVIVGGGVIGLSIAYALARDGITSTVLDRRELGREASWAGAGLIAPTSENRSGSLHPTVELRSWSAELFPRWSAALARRRALTMAIAVAAGSMSPGRPPRSMSCRPRPAGGVSRGSSMSGWLPAIAFGSSPP